MLACVAVATVLALPGAARADIAPPPRGGNGGGSSVAGSNGTAGAAAGSNGTAGAAAGSNGTAGAAAGSNGTAGAPPTPSDDGGGCAVTPSTSWSDFGEGPLAAGMIGVGLAAFFWSRSRRPSR
jgi:hypothetical protein